MSESKLVVAVKEDRNQIRKRLLVVGVAVVGSVLAGVLLTRASGDRTRSLAVIEVLSEKASDLGDK